MSVIDYSSSPEFHAAVTRAQWAVIQTGLITSGLALFGVYVLATRINDLHLMGMYAWGWVPFGPMLVGLIAGSGYILASWWFGVRVGPGMVLAILLTQSAMFVACHYADFETRDLVYRETGQPVRFVTFFDRTTRRLGANDFDPTTEPPALRGYAIRFAEAMTFALGGVLSALTLVGRPKCGLCGGLVRRRSLGRIGGAGAADTLKRLEERVRVGDARGFDAAVAAHADRVLDYESAMELSITRCEVCGVGAVEQVEGAKAPSVVTAAPADAPWHVNVHGDFARQLFEQPPRPQTQAQPSDSVT
jgi:hypothetical protein